MVLAVGVDNIFILVGAYAGLDKENMDSRSQMIGRAVGDVGPSMLLSSISQSCCFFLGNYMLSNFNLYYKPRVTDQNDFN